MKLVTKFILIYLLITTVVLSIAGVISYYIIRSEVRFELKHRLMDRIERAEHLIRQDQRFGKKSGTDKSKVRNLTVRKLDHPVEDHVEVSDTMAWHTWLERKEPNVKVTAYRTIEGTPYYISTFGVLLETDDIREAVIKILLWILGLQVLGAVGVGLFVSSRVFEPFRKTLHQIRNFTLHTREPIEAERDTGVKEFDELNRFISQMTEKAVADYQHLKEFAENASHELQTPLSIARGKLELLQGSDLNAEQHDYVEAAQRSIKKLARLSKSLSLLTKIENYEFSETEDIDLTRLIRDNLEAFEELINLKGLTVEKDIEENVYLAMHPSLADILWSNLLQNAIKHNTEEGYIHIQLTHDFLRVTNPGPPVDEDPEEMFQRFKKGDQSSDSIGLGLSIAQRIVELYGFNITYTYQEPLHTIEIQFTDPTER